MKLSKKQLVIHKHLLKLISAGMKEGDLLPTVAQLSQTLNISPMTVSKAMDKAAELGLVRKVHGKGTFVGNQFKNPKFAKIAGKAPKKTIAFISPFMFDDIFMNDFTLGLIEEINHNHFSVMSKHVLMPLIKEENVISETAEQANGIVLLSNLGSETMKVLRKLRSQCFPIVFLDHYPDNPESVSVCVDNAEGVERIMEHLYTLGHRQITHLTVNNHFSSTVTRMKTYEAFMSRHSLMPQTIVASGKSSSIPRELMSGSNRPTAIFAQNDGLAIRVYQHLKNLGLKVPEDISLVGFDDDDGMDKFELPLTTYAQPKRRIGAKCARIIQDILYGEEIDARHYLIPGELIVRESTGTV